MCHYTHLTPFEREKIFFFLVGGKSITEIAHLLSQSKSTISRELHRNAAPAKHSMPCTSLWLRRPATGGAEPLVWPHKRLENASLRSFVQICILQYHWSPEEIVGRVQLEHGCRIISVSTIYRAVRAGLLNPTGTSAKFVLRRLRHHGKRRHKKGTEERRGKFVISHLIEERPASAEKRTVRGHWKADTCPFYFPAPHHPWERGTNENTNGLLREFFPKGTDITDTPEDYIQRKFHELNLRPRKHLGYKTPYEVYFSKVLHLA